jgi:hypothetical protein
LLDTTSFIGTFAQALSQGFIQLAQSNSTTPGQSGTTLMVDTTGGGNSMVSIAFLSGVEAADLSATHFML